MSVVSGRSQAARHVRFAPKATVGDQGANPPLSAISGNKPLIIDYPRPLYGNVPRAGSQAPLRNKTGKRGEVAWRQASVSICPL